MTKHGWLFMNTNFIANDPSKHNSTNSKTINIFLFNPEICRTLCFLSKTRQFFFITGMDSLITKRKIVDLSIQSIFFHIINLMSSEIFPKHNEYGWFYFRQKQPSEVFCRPATLLKKRLCGTGVFLLILWNF